MCCSGLIAMSLLFPVSFVTCSMLLSSVCGSLVTTFVFTVLALHGAVTVLASVRVRVRFLPSNLIQAFQLVPSSSLFRPAVECLQRCQL